MKKDKLKSILIPFIIVILPQFLVISYYISKNTKQSQVIAIVGILGVVLGIISIILILKNNYDPQRYVAPILISISISIIVILISFLAFFLEGLVFATIMSAIISNIILFSVVKPHTLRESLVLIFAMFPLNIVI